MNYLRVSAAQFSLLAVCWSAGLAAFGQPSASQPPSAPAEKPRDPFAQVPLGKVETKRIGTGIRVVANFPENRHVFDVPGEKIAEVKSKQAGVMVWTVDGAALQVISVPLNMKVVVQDPKEVLSGHQKYENDHWAEGKWTEIKAAQKWIKCPAGEPALYWEIQAPKKKSDDSTRPAVKMFFATSLNGRNVVMLAVTVFADSDEAKARQMLVDTLSSLVRHEPTARAPLAGGASLILLNDDLASRKDRKIQGAVILKPQTLVRIVRMSLELEPDRLDQAALFDGQKGHFVNLGDYVQKEKSFRYFDSLGQRSFLQEENNRAGVKARQAPDGRGWLVTDDELQKVLQAVVGTRFSSVRHYFCTATVEGALMEYRQLQQMEPKSPEVTEARMLKAGQSLLNVGEDVRSAHMFLVCSVLHEKSSRALAGVAASYARAGESEPARNFYADAIKKLPQDPSVSESTRQRLAGAWTEISRACSSSQVLYEKKELTEKDARDTVFKENFQKIFPVKLEAGQRVRIDLTSTVTDPFLRLLDDAGKVLAEDDDGGGNLNARIFFTVQRAGTYKIAVTTFGGEGNTPRPMKTGPFVLSVRAFKFQDHQPSLGQETEKAVNKIKLDLKIEDKLTRDDPLDSRLEKSPHKVHEFKMKAGAVYVIELTSKDFDAFLRVEDSKKKQLAFNDDIARGNLNSRVVFKAPKDDTYRIIATCFDRKVGDYTLTVRKGTEEELPAEK